MKITDIKVRRASDFAYVQVYTDAGIVGLGENGAWGYLDASAEVIGSFREYLLGKDPLQIEHHWQYLYRCYHFRGAAIMGAISAIDIALWDIAGKYYGVPVYKLLGGPVRTKVRTYAQVSGNTTESLIASCKSAVEKGFDAIGHISPFLDEPRNQRFYKSYAQEMSEAADRVGQIREAVGPNVDLCLELHRRMKPGEAVAFSHMVEKYTPMFLEDPTTPDNFDSMAWIADHSNVPIATGERIHTIQEYSMLLERRAMSYARVPVCLCGGLSGAKKVAAIAEAHGVYIIPFNPLSPVSTAATLNLCAAVENVAIMEMPDHYGVSAVKKYSGDDNLKKEALVQANMVDWVPSLVRGFASLPEKPGIGLSLVEDLEERFPYCRRPVQTRLHEDGSIVDQ